MSSELSEERSGSHIPVKDLAVAATRRETRIIGTRTYSTNIITVTGICLYQQTRTWIPQSYSAIPPTGKQIISIRSKSNNLDGPLVTL